MCAAVMANQHFRPRVHIDACVVGHSGSFWANKKLVSEYTEGAVEVYPYLIACRQTRREGESAKHELGFESAMHLS